MENRFIDVYTTLIEKSWGREDYLLLLQRMANDNGLLKWLEIVLSLQSSKELFRDKDTGFILTAYTEKLGQYRKPHDHGSCWVIYAVMSGTTRMRTFSKTSNAETEIDQLTVTDLNSGDSRLFLEGEIHDTYCLSEQVVILRLTSCDLRTEEGEGRMKRFDVASIL